MSVVEFGATTLNNQIHRRLFESYDLLKEGVTNDNFIDLSSMQVHYKCQINSSYA